LVYDEAFHVTVVFKNEFSFYIKLIVHFPETAHRRIARLCRTRSQTYLIWFITFERGGKLPILTLTWTCCVTTKVFLQ